MKIVAIQVIGPNEKHLTENFDDLDRLAPDEVVVVGNNTDPKTEKEIAKRGYTFYRDDREWGISQPYIKTDLLRFVARYEPDWILAKDADEIYDSDLTREGLEEMANRGGIGYYFYIVNFWNDRDHYMKGLGFWNIRFYKYAPELGIEILRKPVHCGLAPPIVYHYGNYAPYMLKHYGLMDPKDRERKVKRYEQYDPRAEHKGQEYYDALKSDYKGSAFNEVEMRGKIRAEVETYKMKNIPTVQNEQEGYCYMSKEDRTIDVPLKDARRYEKQGWVLVSRVNIRKNQPAEAPVVKAEEPKTDEVQDSPISEPGTGGEVQEAPVAKRRVGRPKRS